MKFRIIVLITAMSFLMTGCAVNFYKQSPRSKEKIQELQSRVDELEALRSQEQQQFDQTRRELERRLKSQIDDEEVTLTMRDGGLVIVLSNNILFDSGKAELKSDAYLVLDKVTEIIVEEVPDKNIGVEGHTDNVPITHSSWRSNWELSTARATEVLHYLDNQGVSSDRLSATGYGEHQPVASNDTAEGRAKNRRVEIIIRPDYMEEKYTESETLITK